MVQDCGKWTYDSTTLLCHWPVTVFKSFVLVLCTFCVCMCAFELYFLGTTWVRINCWTEHDDVIKCKLFPRHWPFVRGIHRSPVNSEHKGQWRGALIFSLICAWINGWVNNGEASDLRRHSALYDVTVCQLTCTWWFAICHTLRVIYRAILPIFARLTSVALQQSYDCPIVPEVTRENMDSRILWIHNELII